jgi:hypothetical protein
MTGAAFAPRIRHNSRNAWIQSNVTAISSREVLPANMVSSSEDTLLPSWFPAFSCRMDELSRLPDGWDSYGARALNGEAASDLSRFLRELSFAIQSQPAVSLNDEGGLVAEWQNPYYSLDLVVNPLSEVCVYYHDIAANREWEIPISRCDMLEKWLWLASSRV